MNNMGQMVHNYGNQGVMTPNAQQQPSLGPGILSGSGAPPLYNIWQGGIYIKRKPATKIFDATIATTQFGFQHLWPPQLTICSVERRREYNPQQNSFVVMLETPTIRGAALLEEMRTKNLVAYVDLTPDPNVLVLRVQNGVRNNLVGYLRSKNPGHIPLNIS